MKFKYKNRSFGCRRYYVDNMDKNTVVIAIYIDEQFKEDRILEQLILYKEALFTENMRNSRQVSNYNSAFKQ